jgi:aspartate aminotransferase
MLSAFQERHEYVHKALDQMNGLSCLPSDGTFYSFPNADAVIARLDDVENDIDLAEHFLKVAKVAVVPGSAFGLAGHFRVSYATSMENLEIALDRIEQAIG